MYLIGALPEQTAQAVQRKLVDLLSVSGKGL